MARVDRLPPPPDVPVRSPPVAVRGETETSIAGQASRGEDSGLGPDAKDGAAPALEARVHVPDAPLRAIVLCHPHPLYGGSMHSPVPLAIAKVLADLAESKVAWARFNFRGVGGSEGTYGGGRGEVDDALAVVAWMRAAACGAPVTLCGHSFGSAVALRAAARDGNIDRLLLLAPSARLFPLSGAEHRLTATTTIFIGDKDELCDVDDARELAHVLGAALRVFAGFDHHFIKSRRALAEAALPVMAPEVVSQ